MVDGRNTESRPVRHSRRDVVDAALHLLEQNGLPDLTMRRLAAALDVQPSALYWHFANKQSLLAEVSDRVVGSSAVEPDPLAAWDELTLSAALRLRHSLLAYRDGAELVSSSLALGLGSGATHPALSAAIARGGFDTRSASLAATTLLHFILGHVWHEQQRLQYTRLGVGAAADPAATPAGAAPAAAATPAAAAAPAAAATPATEHDAFVFGVTLLIDGLRRRQ